MEKIVLEIFKYFSFFSYIPSFEEIYTFYPKKITKKKLKRLLLNLEQKKKIISLKTLSSSDRAQSINHNSLYTVGEYSIRKKISKRKLHNWRYKIYVKILSIFPQIKLIGLSGSVAMMNAKEDDDIDLFIITAKNRLFTGRLIALVLAQLLGLRRRISARQFKDKVCLNLFFDENNLKIPKLKQTLFVGHEVLQMKPIINKDNIYQRFIKVNKWVLKLFPNAKSVFDTKKDYIRKIKQKKSFLLDSLLNVVEYILKTYQFKSINRHKTTEIITSTQLWFHPDDFEKKILPWMANKSRNIGNTSVSKSIKQI